MAVRTVPVPGARLHVERTGTGEPLLWVTGFAIGAEVFSPVLPLFAPHFDCITYDNRGAGRSSVPLLPTSMPELAADAVRVLDALGVDAAHVHGVSMGGMVAQELALRFPDRVRSLVLQGTSPGRPPLGPAAAARAPPRSASSGCRVTRERAPPRRRRRAVLARLRRRPPGRRRRPPAPPRRGPGRCPRRGAAPVGQYLARHGLAAARAAGADAGAARRPRRAGPGRERPPARPPHPPAPSSPSSTAPATCRCSSRPSTCATWSWTGWRASARSAPAGLWQVSRPRRSRSRAPSACRPARCAPPAAPCRRRRAWRPGDVPAPDEHSGPARGPRALLSGQAVPDPVRRG